MSRPGRGSSRRRGASICNSDHSDARAWREGERDTERANEHTGDSFALPVLTTVVMLTMQLPMAVLTLVAGVCCLIGMRRLATYIDTITQLQNHQVASQGLRAASIVLAQRL